MTKIRLYEAEESTTKIGTNSAVFASGDFVSVTSGFAVKSTAGKRIIGTANHAITFASDNQTVAREVVSYTRIEPSDTIAELVTSAAISYADVGKYYDVVTGTQLVDIATALVSESGFYTKTDDAGVAIDALVPKQVKLEKVLGVSGTSTVGLFSFV